jgi:hypothetical protein
VTALSYRLAMALNCRRWLICTPSRCLQPHTNAAKPGPDTRQPRLILQRLSTQRHTVNNGWIQHVRDSPPCMLLVLAIQGLALQELTA